MTDTGWDRSASAWFAVLDPVMRDLASGFAGRALARHRLR